jgi:adenine deaminase
MGLDARGGADLIDRLPKCELHIHVEGSLEPELLFDLARRNGLQLAYDSVDALRRAYQFSRLQDFLDIYYQGMSVLLTEQDFYDLAWAYLERARRANVRYLEMFFDPQGHTARGVSFSVVINGLHRAASDAAAKLGIEVRLILCFLRHLDEADAERTLDEALAHRDKFIGVGLDSTEVGHPPDKFARVFRRAREAGLFLTAHAGEEGPPEYIWQALDVLGVERIDHGNRAIEDAALLARLARDRIPLTMCPLSNLRLCVTPDLALHPLRSMLEKDILVTVNSDDPAYFGGGIAENFGAIRDALRLDEREIAAIARNGWRAAFISDDAKADALAAFDRALSTRA